MAIAPFPLVPLADLCSGDRGITYGIVKVGNFVRDGVRVIRGGDIRHNRIIFDDNKRVSDEVSQQFKRTILQGGEIVLNLIAEPGHSAVVPASMSGANVTRDVAVVPVTGADARFVNYYLQSTECVDWLRAHLQGSVTLKINLGTLAALPVPVPPIEEQERIVEMLGAIDEKTESNRRAVDLMEGLGASILAASIGVDPVLDGGALGDFLTTIETGQRPRGGATGHGTVSLGAENVDSAGVGHDSMFKRVPDDFAAAMRRGHLIDGDVLVYKDGAALTSGASIVSAFGYGFPVDAAVINEHVYRLRGNPTMSQALLYWLLRAPAIDSEIRKRVTGAAQPGLNSTNLKAVPLPSFDAETLAKLDAALSPLLVRMLALGAENRKLKALRDALLPELLSGRLRTQKEREEASG